MAGYQQQDAHEFFCFTLEMMSATAGAGGVGLLRMKGGLGLALVG